MKNITSDPESRPAAADVRRRTPTTQTPSASSPRRLRGALVLAGLCAAFLCCLAPVAARAADANPPGKLTYQGFLTDGSGVPYGNTAPLNQAVVFRIWKKATGTASSDLVWAEWQTVTIDKGHFSVLLGEGAAEAANAGVFTQTPATTVFTGNDASDRFMEIALANASGVAQTTISPRLQFQPAPYAALSRSARQVVDDGGNAVLTAAGGNVIFTGNVTGNNFNGNGANLTSLNANNLAAGMVPNGRLSGTYSSALTLNNGGNSFSGNGSGLFGFTASQIPSLDTTKLTTGILPISRGGTGSGSQNFVDMNNSQYNIYGHKSFYNFVAVNGDGSSAPRAPLDVAGNAIITGSLGVGTTIPGATLDVRGNIKLGPSGQFFAPGGEENLRIVRGTVNANGTIRVGAGFASSRTAAGRYTITLINNFSSEPSVTVTPKWGTLAYVGYKIGAAPNFDISVELQVWGDAGFGVDNDFSFIAIGPR